MMISILVLSPVLFSAVDLGAQVKEIRSLVASDSSIEAARKVTELQRALASRVSPARCRPATGEKPAGSAVAPILAALEGAVSQKNEVDACKFATQLGAALQSSIARLTPAARLAQIEKEWLRAGGPQDLESLDRLAWAYFDAGNMTAAGEFAGSVLQKCARLSAGSQAMQLGFYEHSARNALGLVRLQSGAVADASVLLNQSLDVRVDDAKFLAGGPAVRLAEALWKKGEHDAVIRYLTRASRLPWTSAAPSVQKWLVEAQSGKAPAFAGGSGPASK